MVKEVWPERAVCRKHAKSRIKFLWYICECCSLVLSNTSTAQGIALRGFGGEAILLFANVGKGRKKGNLHGYGLKLHCYKLFMRSYKLVLVENPQYQHICFSQQNF